jgi:hypothetical protein
MKGVAILPVPGWCTKESTCLSYGRPCKDL